MQPKQEVVAVGSPNPPETPKKKHIDGYFPPEIYQQMKILCAEKGMTTQDMLASRLNAVFGMYNKPTIA